MFSLQMCFCARFLQTREAMKARAQQMQQQKRLVPGLLKPEQLFGMQQEGGGGGAAAPF